MQIFSNIHKGIPTFLKGISLWENKNRSLEEEKAYLSFKSMVQSILLLLVLGFIIYILCSSIFFKTSNQIVRIGSRQNNEIVYVYKDLKKIHYDADQIPLQENEKVAVFIDPVSQQVSSLQNYEEYKKENDKKSIGLIVLIFGEGILIFSAAFYILKRKGQNFFEWANKKVNETV